MTMREYILGLLIAHGSTDYFILHPYVSGSWDSLLLKDAIRQDLIDAESKSFYFHRGVKCRLTKKALKYIKGD